MHFSRAVIVCIGYFLTSVLSNGLNSDQLKVMIRLYENIKDFTNKNVELKITQDMIEFFGIEEPTKIFKYDSSMPKYVNLLQITIALAKIYNNSSDKVQVRKLTVFEVEYYLQIFVNIFKIHNKPYLLEIKVHPENDNQMGYLTFQQLSEVFSSLTPYYVLNPKLEVLKTKIGVDYVMNMAEFLYNVLETKPGNGLTLEQIEMFNNLYETRNTETGNIDPTACQKVFEDLEITLGEDDLKLLFESNRPAEKVLMDLIIIAAERNKTIKENDFRWLDHGDIVIFINGFNKDNVNNDGLLSGESYRVFKYELKETLSLGKEFVNDLLTLETAQNILKKLDGSDGNEGKKVINIAEYLEVLLLFYKNIKEEKEPILDGSNTDH